DPPRSRAAAVDPVRRCPPDQRSPRSPAGASARRGAPARHPAQPNRKRDRLPDAVDWPWVHTMSARIVYLRKNTRKWRLQTPERCVGLRLLTSLRSLDRGNTAQERPFTINERADQ